VIFALSPEQKRDRDGQELPTVDTIIEMGERERTQTIAYEDDTEHKEVLPTLDTNHETVEWDGNPTFAYE